jgi:hypothetical protein
LNVGRGSIKFNHGGLSVCVGGKAGTYRGEGKRERERKEGVEGSKEEKKKNRGRKKSFNLNPFFSPFVPSLSFSLRTLVCVNNKVAIDLKRSVTCRRKTRMTC